MEQITNLNIEINKLNEIIKNKNNTIQEFRDITDLSKRKIEELLKNKNELLIKINNLEQENKNLKKLYKNSNNNISIQNNTLNDKKGNYSFKIEDYSKIKYDLNEIIKSLKQK